MFVGQYEHTLDGKGRVVLPAKFRSQLATDVYLTVERKGCLGLWAPEEFEKMGEDLVRKAAEGEIEEKDLDLFFALADTVRPDGQGRILVIDRLREAAGINKDMLIVGRFKHVEIWSGDRWAEERIEATA